MAQAIETDVAARLRVGIMRLARLLRSTEAGLAADLSPTRVTVLLNADRNGPVRLAQVAEDEGMNPTLLSRTVAGLADAGLVVRRADPEDRRSAWLEPTEAGMKLALRIRTERTTAVKRALDALSETDRANLEAALPALESLAAGLQA
jgi:DNA-binding MarR family transcriptional regulator